MWARATAPGCAPLQSPEGAQEPPALLVGQRPLPAPPHSSKRQDATDRIDAEDSPFLWFFCLF